MGNALRTVAWCLRKYSERVATGMYEDAKCILGQVGGLRVAYGCLVLA